MLIVTVKGETQNRGKGDKTYLPEIRLFQISEPRLRNKKDEPNAQAKGDAVRRKMSTNEDL
jgi:hypothetical protein